MGRKRKNKSNKKIEYQALVKDGIEIITPIWCSSKEFVGNHYLSIKEWLKEFFKDSRKHIITFYKKQSFGIRDFLVKRGILKNEVKPEDILKRKPYAERIANEIISKNKEGKSTTLAISAKWGSGKTYILDLMKPPLIKLGFKIVEFNPWHYSQERISLKRAFLGELKSALNSKVPTEDLYNDSTIVKFSLSKFIKVSIVLVLVSLSILVLYTLFNNGFENFEEYYKNIISNLLSLGKNVFNFKENDIPALFTIFIIPILSYIASGVVSINYTTSAISTSEKFRDKFKKILGKNSKVVIIVDDLDRCTPEVVKEVLDALATFFIDKRCSFVITGDHTVVEKYVGSKLYLEPEINPTTGNIDLKTTAIKEKTEGRRFLKKLFDVYWQIPQPEPIIFRCFIDDEIKKQKIVNLDDIGKDNLITLLDLFLDKNPRAIIRFISALRFNLDTLSNIIADKTSSLKKLNKVTKKIVQSEIEGLKEVNDNPELLAKVLMMQELFFPAYEKLVINPNLLIEREKEVKLDASKLSTNEDISYLRPEEIFQYIKLLQQKPRFTDDEGIVVFNAENFLYLSGYTGLPSQKGPDDEGFSNLLKGEANLDRLEKSLQIASSERRDNLGNIAESALNSPETVGPVKYGVITNIIGIIKKFSEWDKIFSSLLSQLSKDDFINSPDQPKMEQIVQMFFNLCFEKNIGLDKIFRELPFKDARFTKLKWSALDGVDDNNLAEIASIELINISRSEITSNESESIPKIKKLILKINKSQTTVVTNLDKLLEFIVDLIFMRPVGERLGLLKFIAEVDKDKKSSSKFNQIESDLFKSDNPYDEMKFFFDNLSTLSTYLHSRYINNLITIISNFVANRIPMDWGGLIDQFIQLNNVGDENKSVFLKSIFEKVKSGDMDIFTYSFGYIMKPEFINFFGNDNVFNAMIDSMEQLDGVKLVYTLDSLLSMSIPKELEKSRKSILGKIVKNKNVDLSTKAKTLLKPFRNLRNHNK